MIRSTRQRIGDTTFGIPTSAATLYDCENSWNPLVGAQCILSGQVVQQVTSSVLPGLPGVFPVSSANDPSDPNSSSTNGNFSSWMWLAAAGIAGVALIGAVRR